ncbi:TolA-binding protein [Acetitomaculum ruminis DSM 5522]|uniref:TolA-binding protein n=1 Tax=Acetitomaculum ruminis DSM 5522 TaxID=1120918 RepID=A0A1I1A914_9FIRM|nr:tetratricopeptide repeat protein [Acetitomaculum ruminis]SFB34454.1 TolA-binding protein [Acetitomaculum ruminis DSM 5522]
MKCYNCGIDTGFETICPNCGMNLIINKKIAAFSNYWYNDGLERAKVRDLSGAMESLKKSLKINKENIDARNLLGLIYLEIGETVEALTEWVISKNLQPEDNLAGSYLESVQQNAGRLETINTTIKKYNQAIKYCNEKNDDLAIINLKKVLTINEHLVKAYQLLGLVYIKQENYKKAEKYLKKALNINKTDSRTLRYLKEASSKVEAVKKIKKKSENPEVKVKKEKNRTVYTTGNDTIIQPIAVKERTGLSSVVNIMIGVILGTLVVGFLVIPAINQSAKNDTANSVTKVNEQLADKEAQINDLNKQIEESNKKIEELQKNVETSADTSNTYTNLLTALNYYNAKDFENAANSITSVNTELLSTEAKAMYDSLLAQVNDEVVKIYYTQASNYFKGGDYANAINFYQKVVGINEGYDSGMALFNLARSFELSGDTENAKTYYNKVIESFGKYKIGGLSQKYLEAINAANPDNTEANVQ